MCDSHCEGGRALECVIHTVREAGHSIAVGVLRGHSLRATWRGLRRLTANLASVWGECLYFCSAHVLLKWSGVRRDPLVGQNTVGPSQGGSVHNGVNLALATK